MTRMVPKHGNAWCVFVGLVTLAVVLFQQLYLNHNKNIPTSSAIIRHGKWFML